MALNRNCKTSESKSIKADSNWEVAVVYVNLLKFTETEIKPKGRTYIDFVFECRWDAWPPIFGIAHS